MGKMAKIFKKIAILSLSSVDRNQESFSYLDGCVHLFKISGAQIFSMSQVPHKYLFLIDSAIVFPDFFPPKNIIRNIH